MLTMRFAIVTPVRNGEALVAETVASIVQQSAVVTGRHEIDYVIQDGASTDGTVAAATAAAKGLARIDSEPDMSMYDAVAKGFRKVRGDVYFYLNAGDLLLPGALDLVAELFESRHPDWLCGFHVFYSPRGQVIGWRLPYRYRRAWIRRGVYGRGLPFVQQESTFWSAEAMANVDLDELARFRLAGDHYIWTRLAERSEPLIVGAALGGFRFHGNHLSEAKNEYRREMATISGRVSPLTRFLAIGEIPFWIAPNRIKRLFNPRILRFDVRASTWRGANARNP